MASPGRLRACAPTAVAAVAAVALGACGSAGRGAAGPGGTSTSTSSTVALPGSGRPAITVGDKNFTEQFVIGELYQQALQAQGFDVSLDRNIGPTEVTIPALQSGRVDVYPEYLSQFDRTVAGLGRQFPTRRAAYRAGQGYALAHGLRLLSPTPFADTPGIAVTTAYATANHLRALGDLRRVGGQLDLGAPPQFQADLDGLPAITAAYGFAPAIFTPLAIGTQYAALDHGQVRAADVGTSDGQLVGSHYRLLADPRRVFGWGNVVPVVSAQAVAAEGPAFAATIERVDALLSLNEIRRLNAAVDVLGQTPAAAAHQFLQAHGLVPPAAP
jgi:osmoprotectant transport system substrate-binding protein